eukprot:CAMPEP_0183702362 /NCGR_PEP_ID=MMETSP0737-20130205/489_1 /TAXON_ID=385413 /ORGANISM="Thalassiosira miniscula, Strain CCMP1093" /LENGTH=727 /DNA_ID=CAMNT_0025928959 /DNA_START=44 /DNA_END=2227 /DNA_ORIENTATION=-
MAFTFGDDVPDWAIDDDDPFGDPNDDGDHGNDNPREERVGTHFGAEHLLFLFDCDDSMFEKYVPCIMDDFDDDDNTNEEEDRQQFVSPMDIAITAAHRYLRTKIRDIAETKTGKRDALGVLLYGCDPYRATKQGNDDDSASGDGPVDAHDSDDNSEREELPTTHELIELNPPGIEQVLTLQECRPSNDPNSERQRDLCKEFSPGKKKKKKSEENGEEDEEDNDVCTLYQALTAAQKIFATSKRVKSASASNKQLPDSKAVWIFTNQDDPCHGDESQRARMLGAVKSDCRDAEIDLHVLPLPKKDADEGVNSEFDKNIFYNNLTSRKKRAQDDEEIAFVESETGAVDVEAIVENFAMGTRKRRRYASVPLLLPGWKVRKAQNQPSIMLDLYGAVQVRNKPVKVAVHQEKNKMTIKKTTRRNLETGEVVMPEDVHHFAEFCGRVSIHPADLSKMKRASNSLDEAGLVIHAFHPMKHLPATNRMTRNSIAYANNTRVKGSEKALYNLKLSMLKKDVFAVGELLTRSTATSKLVAFVPKNDEFGGFYIIQLPYKEDVRKVPQNDIGYADPASVDAAKRLISKATLNFEGDFVSCLPENPWLKHFFGYLESVSLGRPLGKVEDDAKMDVERMLETASEEIESFSLSLPEDDLPVKKERKRKTPSSSSATKTEFVKERISEEWIDGYKNDELDLLKNDELKAFLKSQGERVTGKKSDLVDRVIRVIQKELFKE